jgi:hypothetical protein
MLYRFCFFDIYYRVLTEREGEESKTAKTSALAAIPRHKTAG